MVHDLSSKRRETAWILSTVLLQNERVISIVRKDLEVGSYGVPVV